LGSGSLGSTAWEEGACSLSRGAGAPLLLISGSCHWGRPGASRRREVHPARRELEQFTCGKRKEGKTGKWRAPLRFGKRKEG